MVTHFRRPSLAAPAALPLACILTACAPSSKSESEVYAATARPISLVSPTDVVAQLDELRAYVDNLYDISDSVAVVRHEDMTYDCLPIERQPTAVALGLSRKHLLEMRDRAEELSAGLQAEAGSEGTAAESAGQARAGRLSEPCPEGTVPFERWTDEQLRAFGSLDNFLGAPTPPEPAPSGSDRRWVTTHDDGIFHGTRANFNIWNLEVDRYNDFSLSQFWLINDEDGFSDLEAIEFGVQEAPWRTSFHTPRIFIFWRHNFDEGGCYNNNCPGFVKTDPGFAFSASLSAFHSVTNGSQFSIALRTHHELDNSKWWLACDNEVFGYYPDSLFDDLEDGSTYIEYGGEVYSNIASGWTTTNMGSGAFPSAGFGEAMYIRKIRHRGVSTWNDAEHESVSATDSDCYDIETFSSGDPEWATNIFMGGEGEEASGCP